MAKIPRVSSGVSLSEKSGTNGSSSAAMNGTSASRHPAEVTGPPDARWTRLYRAAHGHIVDPADVPAVIDERLSGAIDRLSPTEITAVQRRVRDVVRAVCGSDSASSTGGRSGGASSAMSNVMGKLNPLGGGGGSGGSGGSDAARDERSKATYQKDNVMDEHLIRKIFVGGRGVLRRGYDDGVAHGSRAVYVRRREASVAAAGAAVPDPWGGLPSSQFSSLPSDAVGAPAGDTEPKQAQQQQPQQQQHGRKGKHHNGSHALYLGTFSKHGHHHSSHGHGHGHGERQSQRRGQQRQQRQAQAEQADPIGSAYALMLHMSESRWDYVAGVARLSATRAGLEMDVNKRKVPPKKKTKRKDNGSLSLLEAARASSRASKGEGDGDAPDAAAAAAAAAAAEDEEEPVPPPVPLLPPSEAYDDLPLDAKDAAPILPPAGPPPLPAGITMTSLCFLMATALRGTRAQRLNLLFYLLLPAETLTEVLRAHPAGGVPTWLLEGGLTPATGGGGTSAGEEAHGDAPVVLSYASLGHYYYYGGTIAGEEEEEGATAAAAAAAVASDSATEAGTTAQQAASSSDGSGASGGSGGGRLVLSAQRAIGTVAVLLMDALGGTDRTPEGSVSGSSAAAGSADEARQAADGGAPGAPPPPPGSVGRMHALLDGTLRESREGRPRAWRRSMSLGFKERLMDTFWGASYGSFDSGGAPPPPGTENSDPYGPTSAAPPAPCDAVWDQREFVAWAGRAMADDSVLDMVLHRLFGTGILPTPGMERDLVGSAWVEWQLRDGRFLGKGGGGLGKDGADDVDRNGGSGGMDYLCSLTETVQTALGGSGASSGAAADGGKGGGGIAAYDDVDGGPSLPPSSLPFGGIGGIDGRGGLGRGIMYCVERRWWDEWTAYSGWAWAEYGDGGGGGGGGDDDRPPAPPPRIKSKRPHELSTDGLLATASESVPPRGTLGSYELMVPNAANGADYVLLPPAVWDVLYELYGGGPPLPRMVVPPTAAENGGGSGNGGTGGGGGSDGRHSLIGAIVDDMSAHNVEVVAASRDSRPRRIPRHVEVATHPWVLHCHICDPHQPYRRGDAGPVSIRVMATPDQPLWRLLGEIVVRLPVHHPKARDGAGLGRLRLWKRMDLNGKDAAAGVTRYGPWSLLCKSRCASFPVGDVTQGGSYENLKDDWLAYTDNGSVESVGLTDGMRIMFEYALVGKDGKFTWPREAAAKAGRVRRIADEDADFRLMLRGLDSTRKLLKGDSPLLGKTVDAMDASGRWYQAEIVEIDNKDHGGEDGLVQDGDSTSFEEGDDKPVPGEIKAVRVDFSRTGGHDEWIDVKSDRLAVAGRFTLDSMKNMDSNLEGSPAGAQSSGEVKGKSVAGKKHPGSNESASDPINNGKVCPFPGYGACGLTNLGNTCYANSALQCISYMPLLRSYLISGQYKVNGDLNKDNPLGTGGKVLEEFVELLRVMYSGKYGVRAPSRLRGQLGKARSQYSGGDQQDAQELLNDMLDSLHEDSNKVMKKPYVEALEDDWVKHTGLPRVGLEAWRRFLRRNRSVIADVAMGQVLNRVTCPVCKHESRNFDPFNMLSIPFPTVAEVIFRCKVVRRGTALNCPTTLGRRETKRSAGDQNAHDERNAEPPSPPSGKLIVEEYVVPMSRLADVGDLKLRLQNISGISANRFKLCKAEEIVVNASAESSDPARTYFKVTALPEKEGPCIQLARQLSTNNKQASKADDVSTPSITQIIAFESTLNNRPPIDEGKRSDSAASSDVTDEESTADEDEEEPRGRSDSTTQHQRIVQKQLEVYGDRDECRLFDTNPTPLSKAMSRCLWPKSSSDFKLGLRVDAIDHRNHWFPGSVVEIIEGTDDSDEEEGEGKGDDTTTTKVRIHFDNFSSKWDETYTIDHFKRGQVRPLYSHANPRPKPTEFLVHHRHKYNKGNALFGQPFYLQCHNEWSTARAGAQILTQASRFLQPQANRRRDQTDKFYQSSEKARLVIAQIIDMLIESDRKYVDAALRPPGTKDSEGRDRVFNASLMSSKLSKKLSTLLPLLPFDVRVCTADAPLGGHHGNSSDEVAFPFSLVRTIGNYMNARHAVVLHWREKSSAKHRTSDPPRHPLLYAEPTVGIHKRSSELLKTGQPGKAPDAPHGASNGAHGGLQLGVCLDEFCKEQHLPETDSWRCPKCKEVREGKQHMILWRLPDILTFHLKRFNCSARWREKITTKVNFPLTGLNMSEWCDEESPALEGPEESCVYDLIGVMNHYGGMTGGHYVATCKATACGSDGSEEVAYNFNGAGIREIGTEEETVQSGWKLGRSKEKDAANASSKAATAAARFVAESSEPLWLQFDDDLVEPIPPKQVVSEMAYVLFYRRRRISPSNIAKYSTLE